MKDKQKIKIGISLLIALMFLVPSASVLAGSAGSTQSTVENKASDKPTAPASGLKGNVNLDEFEIIQLPTNPSSQQQGCPVEVQSLISPELNGAHMMPGGTYPITVNVFNFPGCGEATVKLFVDIYQKTEGTSVNMYKTSFEDNFDIYNNWVQIDGDCGLVGGYYDSWSWSDARATDGDHSMKTTMYDIYKGNQDDYLQCTRVFDISEQDAVNVSFDVWVEGQYIDIWSTAYGDAYSPIDYVSFEFSDDGGITWTNPDWGFNGLANTNDEMLFVGSASDTYVVEGQYNPGGGYYFFDLTVPIWDYDPPQSYFYKAEKTTDGFWHVWWNCPVALLDAYGYDTTNLMFRFDWHTDPEHQYEGGYIDNFEVNSIEKMETKVFQSHSQGPIVLQECDNKYTFPMEWTVPSGDKDNAYDIRIWMEVLDENHFSLNDWPDYLDIYALVTDWYDVEMVDDSLIITTSFGEDPVLPGTGIIMQGSDAHIQAQVHVDGTLPVPSVQVTATAYKKSWKTLYSENFEAPLAWDTYGIAHRASDTYWSATHCLGFFDEDIHRYKPTDTFSYAISPYAIDFKDKLAVQMDFYYRYLTEPTGDVWRTCFLDPVSNFVLGWGTKSGYSPEWIGPMQPECSYTTMDLLYYYNYWHYTRGFFYDNDGNQVWKAAVGFYMSTDGDSINYNSQAVAEGIYTSGVWIDDVVIRAEELAATPIWTKTQSFSGPFEPCETINVQFEWEDVPYSNYRICVDATAQGACGNLGSEPLCAQILSVTNLEMAHWKEVEFEDYTCDSNGAWGISSSDTDNYLATNTGELYPADSRAIADLCIDGDECIDISSLFGGGGVVPVDFINEDMETFTGFVPPAGWTTDNFQGYDPGLGTGIMADLWWLAADGDDYLQSPVVDTSGVSTLTLDFFHYYDYYTPGTCSAYVEISTNGGTSWTDITPWSNPINGNIGPESRSINILPYASATMCVRFHFVGYYIDIDDWFIDDVHIYGDIYLSVTPPADLWMYFDAWWDLEDGFDFVYLQVANCPAEVYSDWHTVATFNGESRWEFGADDDGWIPGYAVDLVFPGMSTQIQVRFLFMSDEGWNFRGMKIDDLTIPDLEFFQENGPDPMDNMDNWCVSSYCLGNFWTYDSLTGMWCITWPAAPVLNGMIWSTEIQDAYEAYLSFQWSKTITSAYPEVRVQVSADGGVSWYTICIFTSTYPAGSSGTYSYDLTPFVGKQILIRVLVDAENYAGLVGAGTFCIWNLTITGKQDSIPPVTTMTMSGTQKESGWYTTPVKFVITATDVGAGMGDIHYTVDGKETVVAGAKAEFTVSGNGAHNVAYWGVDKVGNTEAKHTVPAFKIDSGAAPTVSITAPESGIYLFGKKLMSFSKPLIIGAFTATATASDVDSGVYRVTFYLDGDVVGEDTTAPFSAYIAQKHMGAGTLKVVAEDFAQNKAETSLDITYYKFL